jgi:competence protein ComEC
MRPSRKSSGTWEPPYGEKRVEMTRRPLIPILMAFSGGILFGHHILSSLEGSADLLLLSLVVLFLSISLCVSSRLKVSSRLILFFLIGALLDLQNHSPSALAPLAAEREKVTVEGTVLEPVQFLEEIERLKVRAHRCFIRGRPRSMDEILLVTVYDRAVQLQPGERIRFPAKLKPFKNFNNPGAYDYESAMKLKGISCAASVSDGRYIVPMGQGDLPFPMSLLESIRAPVRNFLEEKLEPQEKALMGAMILGERHDVTREMREPFDRAGLGHILAVSGLHIGLVASLFFFFSRVILVRSYNLALRTDVRKLAALFTCLPVVFYTALAGFQISGQRAMIMVLVFLWALILGREKEIWSVLAFAALVILAVDPHSLYSVSFQLSFLAVVGILWLSPRFLNFFPSITEPSRGPSSLLMRYVIGLVGVSLSAVLFVLPVGAFYFHRISLVSLPSNLTALPVLGFWILPFGLLSAVILPFSAAAADFFLKVSTWGLHGMTALIHFWSSPPYSSLWVVTPNHFEMGLFYALLTAGLFFRRGPRVRLAFFGLLTMAAVDTGYWVHRTCFSVDLRVTYLDVGQGNAALVEFPGGKRMVIDGGGLSRDHFDVGQMVVAPYLWRSKITRVDFLVLSHPQADHLNGLRFLAKAFHPKEFWHNGDEVETDGFRDLMSIVKSRKIRVCLPGDLQKGRVIQGVKMDMLHPLPGDDPSWGKGELNNRSLVLKLSFGGTSFLFAGDLEERGEETAVSRAGPALRSHILLSPHHGSQSSSSMGFLEAVRPGICVISSGEGNIFGFPHEQTLRRLEALHCRVLRIDQQGAVQCRVGPEGLETTTYLP